MNPLFAVWNFFATYILQKAPYMVGFLTLLGYCLMGKKWYDTLAGTLKAIIGMLILNAGSGGLTSNFRPILAGLKDRFNLTACVIDPYYGQNAVTAGVEETFGKDSGFQNRFYPKKKGEYRMDILACPYCRYFTELGCFDLTRIFCENDERGYGNLPGLVFERTGTLGKGAERCDFCIRKASKP